ncbi:hypothetical protein [Candidatus Methanomassiliicoccus intestinalis]|uniref:hypothetical protein n=1 Tax=Candidatus Methanomassiliicoccus intestinalis TaxID=1406512 RepID=UPI0037DDB9F0
MPAVKVYAKKMDARLQEALAEQLLTIIQKDLQVPVADIIFFDVAKIYGVEQREQCLLEIEGPEKSAEIVEHCGQQLCIVFQKVTGWDCNVSVIYHPNAPQHVIDSRGSLANILN